MTGKIAIAYLSFLAEVLYSISILVDNQIDLLTMGFKINCINGEFKI